MGKYQLVLYPDAVLRQRAHEVSQIDGKTYDLLKAMQEIMYRYKGIGLAAPQVGYLQRIIIADTGEGLLALINPEIVQQEGNARQDEGCLSLPEVRVEVPRSESIAVRAWDADGKERQLELKGLSARVVQHEIDHLNGRLIIDYASTAERLKNAAQLEKLEKMFKFKVL